MIYRIFKNTYRIPVKLQDELKIPSLYTICDYIAGHAADCRQCILDIDDAATAKKKWDEFKSLSLFIPAPFPYILVEQYELDETDLSKNVGFITEKKVEPVSNMDFWSAEEMDKLIMGIKLDRYTRELAEKQKTEGLNNGKRRR